MAWLTLVSQQRKWHKSREGIYRNKRERESLEGKVKEGERRD